MHRSTEGLQVAYFYLSNDVVLYQATKYFITCAFCFCNVLMCCFDAFAFGSNPLCSSNIIFVFYISPIIPHFFPSLFLSVSAALFSALTPSVNIPTSHIPERRALIESARRGEQQFMHIKATKMYVKHSLS